MINVLWAVLNTYRVFNTAHNIYEKSLVPCVLVFRAIFSIRLVALAVRAFTRAVVRRTGARILFARSALTVGLRLEPAQVLFIVVG